MDIDCPWQAISCWSTADDAQAARSDTIPVILAGRLEKVAVARAKEPKRSNEAEAVHDTADTAESRRHAQSSQTPALHLASLLLLLLLEPGSIRVWVNQERLRSILSTNCSPRVTSERLVTRLSSNLTIQYSLQYQQYSSKCYQSMQTTSTKYQYQQQ
eukprot:328734-Rhodomonas_salina.2